MVAERYSLPGRSSLSSDSSIGSSSIAGYSGRVSADTEIFDRYRMAHERLVQNYLALRSVSGPDYSGRKEDNSLGKDRGVTARPGLG